MSRNRLKKWGKGNQLLNWFKRYFTNSYSPRKHRTQRGFVLPLVIGIGLLMVLLSVTIIARSQSSQVSTSNLKQAAQGSEAAEIGAAQVQSLFTQYKQLPRITLANVDLTSTPKVTTWTKAANIFPASCGAPAASASTLLNSLLKKEGTTTAWVKIDDSTPTTASTRTKRFRVISYDYTPISTATNAVTASATVAALTIPASTIASGFFAVTTTPVTTNLYLASGASVYGQMSGIPGTLKNTDSSGSNYTFTPVIASSASTDITLGTPFYPISNTSANVDTGVGNLWVEGQIVSDTSAAEANIIVYSTSGLQVGIPVNPGNVLSIPIPGTWIGSQFTPANNVSNGPGFDSDTLVPCGTSTSGVRTEAGRITKITEVSIPTVPTAPSTAYTFTSPITSSITLPITTGSTPSGYNPLTGGYDYIVSAINIGGSDEVIINPNYKVTIYLSGNIDVSGNANIVHKSTLPTGVLNVSPPSTSVTLTGNTSPDLPNIKLLTNGSAVPVVPLSLNYLPNVNDKVYGILGSSSSSGISGVPGIPGNLIKTGTATYSFTPTTAPATEIIVAAGSTFYPQKSPYKPVDFKIYAGGTTGHICLSGGSSIDAFVLAPKYSYGFNGLGNGTAITGAIWVGIFPSPDCTSSPNKFVVTQNATWDDIGLEPVNLPPYPQPIQTWIKKEGT